MKRKGKLSSDEIVRTRGLFDHVKHIRQVQSKDYYDTLSESERKTFNKFMILRVLSMDQKIVEEISYISKYMEVLPDKQFYSLLVQCIPKDYKFYPYIKKTAKDVDANIVNCICKKYQIGSSDATDYYTLFIQTEAGVNELVNLVQSFGYSQSEVEKMFDVKE